MTRIVGKTSFKALNFPRLRRLE